MNKILSVFSLKKVGVLSGVLVLAGTMLVVGTFPRVGELVFAENTDCTAQATAADNAHNGSPHLNDVFTPLYGVNDIKGCNDYPALAVMGPSDTAVKDNTTAQVGDTVGVQIYVHNEALQFPAGSSEANARIAHNVQGSITIDGSKISTSFSGSNTNSAGGYAIINIPAGATLELVPGSGHFYDYNLGGAQGSSSLSGTSGSFNMGDVQACFDNSRFLIFQVKVVGPAVSSVPGTGQISASPNTTCLANGLIGGSATWNSSSSVKGVKVTIQDITDNGPVNQLTGDYESPNFTTSTDWLTGGHSYRYILYDVTSGSAVKLNDFTENVPNINCNGTPPVTGNNGITFSVGQCLGNGSNLLNGTVSWRSSSDIQSVYVTVQDLTSGQAATHLTGDGANPTDQTNTPWLSTNHSYQFILYNQANGQELARTSPQTVTQSCGGSTPPPPANVTVTLSINTTNFCVGDQPQYTVHATGSVAQKDIVWASTKNGVSTGEFNDFYGQLLDDTGSWSGFGARAWNSSDVGTWTKTASVFDPIAYKILAVSQPVTFTVRDCSTQTNPPPVTTTQTFTATAVASATASASCPNGTTASASASATASGTSTISQQDAQNKADAAAAQMHAQVFAQAQASATANCPATTTPPPPAAACADGVQLSAQEFVAAVQSGKIIEQDIALDQANHKASFTITNNTGCSAPISLSSYKMFDNVLSHQVFLSGDGVRNVAKNSTATFTVDFADCRSQIDAWYGQFPTQLLDSDPYHYPNVPFVLKAVVTGSNFCSSTPACISDSNPAINASTPVKQGSTYSTVLSWSFTGANQVRITQVGPGGETAVTTSASNPGVFTVSGLQAGTSYIFKMFDANCGGLLTTVTVVTPGNVGQLTCVASSGVINSGQQANFTVSGGTGPYTWTGENGTFTGPTFNPTYSNNTSIAANHSVTVTSGDGQSASCSVVVNGQAQQTSTGNCDNDSNSCNHNTNNNNQTSSGNNSGNQNNQNNVNGNNNNISNQNNNCVNYSCNIVYINTAGNVVPSNQYSQLSITKMVSSSGTGFQNSVSVANGQTVQFQITVTNSGNATANNVRLTDNLPSGLSLNNGSISSNGGYSNSNNLLSGMFLGNLTSGQSFTVTFSATVNGVFQNSIQNTATASSDNAGSVQASAWVFVNTGSVQGGSVNLSYSKRAFNETKNADATSVTASKEDFITYTLTVNNNGNTPANNFVITDDLSQVLPYTDISDNGGGTVSGNVISYQGITVPAGGSVSKSFKVRVKFFLADNLSYVMNNTYGNTVTIKINNPQVLGAFVAPKTGADTDAFVFSGILTGAAALLKKRKALLKLIFT